MKAMITIPAVFLVLFTVGFLPLPGFFSGTGAATVTLAVFHRNVITDEMMAVLANELRAEPSATRHSSFLRGVRHVGFLIAEEEVRGIAAGRIVAAMANENRVGNFAERELPREAMSQNAALSFVELVSNGVLAVAAGQFESKPRPAGIRTTALVDLRPEQFNRGLSFVSSHNERDINTILSKVKGV